MTDPQEQLIQASIPVGMSTTPLYGLWRAMLHRCEDPTNKRYVRYGGRGIRVCARWHDFGNFLSDMGERPEGMTIDRIDNDGDYEPGNCRWATRKQQANNTSSNRFWEHNGQRRTIAEWATVVDIKEVTIRARVDHYGWSFSDAISLPTGTHVNPTTYRTKAVIARAPDGTETVYPSAKDAALATGVNFRNISAVCCGRWQTAGGYFWRFA